MLKPFAYAVLLATALPSLPLLAQHRPQEAHEQRENRFELRGQVTDINGEPLVGATVRLTNTDLVAITGKGGFYHLTRLPKGEHTISVFRIGYEHIEKAVRFGKGSDEHRHLDFVLAERQSDLPQVEVTGRRERSYKNSVSFIGTKTATLLKDVPQSVGYVTKELTLDQGAYSVNDVVKNISGVNPYTFYNDFSIRGFRTTGNRNSGNLLNGMRAQTSLWRQSSLATIERVEVIKGPSSALFGNASPGGVINRVTKKPLDYQRNSVSATVGSFNTLRTFGDFTGPLNGKKTLLYRLNLGYENTDGFRDLQSAQSYTLAPSFSYIPNERTQLNLDFVYQANRGKVDRGQTIFGNAPLTSRPITASLSAANDYLNEEHLNFTLALSHKLTDCLTFNSTYLLSTYNEDLQEHTQANAYAANADGTDDPNRVLMRMMQRKRFFRNNSFNNYLTWNVQTGSVSHRLLLGYDYFQTELLPGSSYIEAGGYLLKNGKTTNKFDVAKIGNYLLDADGNPRTNVPAFDLRTNSGNQYQDISKYIFVSKSNNPSRQYSHGIYLQEQLEWWRLKVLLGGRMEYFTDVKRAADGSEQSTTQKAFIPRIGAVYTLTPDINLYATWIKGYEPQDVAIQSNPETDAPFDPLTSRLWEVGAKSEWFDKRVSLTLALFHLTQRNTLYNAGDKTHPERMVQIGEEVSKGIELDMAGRILPFWSIVANYAFNVAEITKAPQNTKDLRLQRPNTPRHSANLWTKFIVPRGKWRDLGVGIGANFVSSRDGQVGKREQTVAYPAYFLLNAALYYKVREVQLQVNFNNLLDKTHWVGGYDRLRSFPGMPRNINFTATYNF